MDIIIDRRTSASVGRVDQNDLLEVTDVVLRNYAECLTKLLPLHVDAAVHRELSFLLGEVKAARAALTLRYLKS